MALTGTAAFTNNYIECFSAVCPAVQTYFKMLTAAVALLITSIQTVIISITLPQGLYAPMIMALELIIFTPL